MMLEMIMEVRFLDFEWKEFLKSKAKPSDQRTHVIDGKKEKTVMGDNKPVKWMDSLQFSVWPIQVNVSYSASEKAWLPSGNYVCGKSVLK
jgi:hypothetical protein